MIATDSAAGTVSIPLNQNTVAVIGVISAALALIGLWLFLLDEDAIDAWGRAGDPWIVWGGGWVLFFLFGAAALAAFRKLRQSPAGLVLGADGLDDRSSAAGAGLVPWSDITAIEPFETQSQRYIAVKVRNPEHYIRRGGTIASHVMEANRQAGGTPVLIPVRALKMRDADLWDLVNRYAEEHGGVT